MKNLLILALTQFCTRIFLIGPKAALQQHLLEPEIYILILCTLLVAAAGYIINDYYDIKIDMINKPNRVVLGRIISRRVGLLLHLVLNVSALAIATVFLSINVALFILACETLLWLYSNYLKRTPFFGNLCISLLAFASLFIIGLFYKIYMYRVMYYAVFAFAMNLVRELVKDIEDIEGDQAHNSSTLPIRIGIKQTKYVLYLFSATIIGGIAYSFTLLNTLHFAYLVMFAIVPLGYIMYSIYRAGSSADFAKISTLSKMVMVLGILSMILI